MANELPKLQIIKIEMEFKPYDKSSLDWIVANTDKIQIQLQKKLGLILKKAGFVPNAVDEIEEDDKNGK